MEDSSPIPPHQILRSELLKQLPSSATTLNEKPSNLSIQKVLAPVSASEELNKDVHPKPGFITSIRMLFSTIDRIVYTVVVLVNLAIFLWVCSIYRNPDNKILVALWVGLPAIGNLFAGSQDPIMNIMWIPLTFIPPSWPLFLRRIAAGFLAVETIHASTSLVGAIWLILFTAQMTMEVVRGGLTSVRTVVVTYVILAMVIVLLVLCLPACQRAMQNKFVYTHRYLAWAILVVVWAQISILNVDYTPKTQTLGQFSLTAPPFWMILILTVTTVIPWANMLKVKCETEHMSNDCIRLHLVGTPLYLGK